MSCLSKLEIAIQFNKSRFWDLETLGILENEKNSEDDFLENIKLNDAGRYEVELPFKANHPVLGDNLETAKKRLKNTFTKLKTSPELLKRYDDIFREQEHFGIIEPAIETGNVGEIHYLPHHAGHITRVY